MSSASTSTSTDDQQLAPAGPFRLTGKVVKGFGRGSKLLGFPTANLDPSAFEQCLDQEQDGVYAGWVAVERGAVLPTVLSIGWNPHFKNKNRTVVRGGWMHTLCAVMWEKGLSLRGWTGAAFCLWWPRGGCQVT